jgi:23S rRNA-/tRNA-specific pseudouridylate synthase
MGSRAVDVHNGQAAHTNFKVIRRDIDGTSLLEAQPLTGRTNQIRVHLWHLGWPVRGDSVYLPDHELGDRQTLDIDSPPMCLHAWHIAFTHPMRRETVSFTAAAPGWAHIDGSPPSNQG